jgi:hypothetical protein
MVIAVIGAQAATPTVHGGGSGSVIPTYVIAPLDALRAHLAHHAGVQVTYNDGSDPATAATAAAAAYVEMMDLVEVYCVVRVEQGEHLPVRFERMRLTSVHVPRSASVLSTTGSAALTHNRSHHALLQGCGDRCGGRSVCRGV